MTNNEKKILEEFIAYKEKQDHKWLVIDKSFITEECYNCGEYSLRLIMPHGKTTHYEFLGDSVIGKIMELYAELNKAQQANKCERCKYYEQSIGYCEKLETIKGASSSCERWEEK